MIYINIKYLQNTQICVYLQYNFKQKKMTTKEIAKEIRNTIKGLKGVKLSITTDINNISIALMEANFKATTKEKQYVQLNQWYMGFDENITKEVITLFSIIQEVIDKYHYDMSDYMTDYFNTNFYYNYSVGKWDKNFKQVN